MAGRALVRFDTALLTHTAVGLTGYMLGVAAGTWITGRGKSDGALSPGSGLHFGAPHLRRNWKSWSPSAPAGKRRTARPRVRRNWPC